MFAKTNCEFLSNSNHKGDTIGKVVKSCLHGWRIKRVFTITVDNATVNDVTVNVVRKRVNG